MKLHDDYIKLKKNRKRNQDKKNQEESSAVSVFLILPQVTH